MIDWKFLATELESIGFVKAPSEHEKSEHEFESEYICLRTMKTLSGEKLVISAQPDMGMVFLSSIDLGALDQESVIKIAEIYTGIVKANQPDLVNA